jgi:hypothetical protein
VQPTTEVKHWANILILQNFRIQKSKRRFKTDGFNGKRPFACKKGAWKPINEGIKLKFFNISVICCNSPTEDAEDVDKDAFYEALGNAYDQCAFHHIKIVVGNFNSQIGKENIFGKTTGSFSVHNKTNKNGLRLIDFAAIRNMIS